MALDNNIDELQIEIYTESEKAVEGLDSLHTCLLYTSPSPRDA